jgi:hypothetical protein
MFMTIVSSPFLNIISISHSPSLLLIIQHMILDVLLELLCTLDTMPFYILAGSLFSTTEISTTFRC